MIALTIRQPWASLIVLGHKNIENRSWRPPSRVLGSSLLIHAGKRDDPDGYERARRMGIVLPDDLPRGGIIGQVDVIGCVDDSESPWASVAQWHWQLANARSLPFQPMRGHLGLFHVGPRPQTTLW